MVPGPKPEASFASTRLTRTNYGGPNLLSQVGGRTTRNYEYNDPSDETSQKAQQKKVEPATDDDPISSSDESEQLSPAPGLSPVRTPSKRTFEWSAKDLETKLAEGDTVADKLHTRGSKKAVKAKPSPRRGGRRSERVHTAQDSVQTPTRITDGGHSEPGHGDDDELFPHIASSLRASKRRKSLVYGSGIRNIHVSAKPKQRMKFIVPASGMDDNGAAIQSSQATTSGSEFRHPIPFPTDNFSSFSPPTASGDVENLIYDIGDSDASLSPLSSVSSTISQRLSPTEKAFLGKVAGRSALCPVCKQSVDAVFLGEFNFGKGLSVRQQVAFCRAHRKRAAEQEWVDKGYPEINWEEMDKRIQGHFSDLEKILTLQTQSFYRNALLSSADSIKKDNFRLTFTSDSLERMSSGYYGSRGSKMMYILPQWLVFQS